MTGDRSGGVVLTEAEREALDSTLRWHLNVVAEQGKGSAYISLAVQNAELAVEGIVAGRVAAVKDVLREGLADESLEATGVMERALAALTATTEEQA